MENLIIKKQHKSDSQHNNDHDKHEQRPPSRSSVTSLKTKNKKIQQNKDFLENPNIVS